MLTQERLKQLLNYDPETGVFTWKEDRRGGAKAGCVAGSYTRGYREVRIDSRRYLSHRLAWLYIHGSFPVDELDHINRIKSDNRIANLREATHGQQGYNQGRRSNNRSGFKGGCWHKQRRKWLAQIMINGKRKHLGYFSTALEAALAYDKAAIRLFGPFACVNFPIGQQRAA
jgi:hypothetical protein